MMHWKKFFHPPASSCWMSEVVTGGEALRPSTSQG